LAVVKNNFSDIIDKVYVIFLSIAENTRQKEFSMKAITKNKRIKVIVNGREMEVYDNLTILQALLQEDVHIPHLCYDIRLERSNGNFGLCVVEVGEGMPRET